jgi:hypothetical protein
MNSWGVAANLDLRGNMAVEQRFRLSSLLIDGSGQLSRSCVGNVSRPLGGRQGGLDEHRQNSARCRLDLDAPGAKQRGAARLPDE